MNMTVGFGIPSVCVYVCVPHWHLNICMGSILFLLWLYGPFKCNLCLPTIPAHSCLSSAFFLHGFYLYLVFTEICYRSVPSEH
jgi:hypothetical protein